MIFFITPRPVFVTTDQSCYNNLIHVMRKPTFCICMYVCMYVCMSTASPPLGDYVQVRVCALLVEEIL